MNAPDRNDLPRAGSPWRPVAAAGAIALGAIGAAAAPRLGLPGAVGFVVGALAATLAVFALPSLPTRQVAVVMLGLAGLGALRHAALPTTDSIVIVVWAFATLLALVLVDRAHAEQAQALADGRALPSRVPEALRVGAIVAAAVVVVAVALVPTVTDRIGRHSWPGRMPSFDDGEAATSSLRETPRLDMTSRPRLSDRIVFTVDAPRADFWRGEVYDTWDGRGWTRRPAARPRGLARPGDEFAHSPAPFDESVPRGTAMRQTFRIETGFSEILFAAPTPVAIESDRAVVPRADGTVGLLGEFGKGAVYTVTSRSTLPTADDLRDADAAAMPSEISDRYTENPIATDRVRALAAEITAGAPTTYDKVRAIEDWLGQHTRYSLDAPLSPGNVDVVDHFLFESRLGWCEQVSSSMTVLARSVGIPARLATGFVPGERDGLSGHFVVRERDAHAWAEIYFPGVGWQGFDPTASVPLAGEAPSSGSWMDRARSHALEFALVVAGLAWLATSAPNLIATLRRRASARKSWARRTQARLDRLGRRRGRARRTSETAREYASAVATVIGDPRLERVGDAIDREVFAPTGAGPQARADADAVLATVPSRHKT